MFRLKNPRRSLAYLGASIFVGLVPYGEKLATWSDLLEPSETFAFLGIIGAVVIAWLGESPLRTK